MELDPLTSGPGSDGPAVGLFVQLFEPAVVELAGRLSIDFVILDMEHTSVTLETIEEMVIAAKSVDLTTLVRLPGHDPDTLRRALDIGANGVLIPRIASVEDLERLCNAAYFAPEGSRGSCSLTRSCDFTLGSDDTYHERENEGTVILGLIELKTAVGDIDAILETELLDGIVLGPGDLAQSMGHASDLQHPEVVDNLRKVLSAAENTSVPVAAYAVSAEDAAEWVDRGANCVLYSDVRLFRGAIEGISR